MKKWFDRWMVLLGFLAAFCVVCFPGVAQAESTQEELNQLKDAVKAMQQTVNELNNKILELEKKQSQAMQEMEQEHKQAIQALEKEQGKSFAEVVAAYPKYEKPEGKESPITYEDAFQDRQTAAPRLDDYTMDPDFHGFIPVPHTNWFVKFNARPRVDITWDNRTSGDTDRFVTAKIPVRGQPNYDGDSEFNINSRASHLSFEASAPNLPGDPRFFYENDFFGSGSNEYNYRIKHLYGKVYNLVFGHTFSVFEDPDIWPDTVDFEGPNSMVFARWPLVHYMHQLSEEWVLTVGIEQPDSLPSVFERGAESETVDSVNSWPDGGFNVRWERDDVGHMQFATILRSVGARSETYGEDDVFGWGTNLSVDFALFGSDTLKAQLTYGEGIGRYGNDTSFELSDAAYDNDGDLEALSYFGGFLGYTHEWSDVWRSTATYGYVKLDNEKSQGPDAYDTTHYASMNLIYRLSKKMSIGVEGLYGKREVASGEDGDVFRLQTGIHYRLF